MATAQATTDREQIREWGEARGGHPARVKSTGNRNDPGLPRIDFAHVRQTGRKRDKPRSRFSRLVNR